MQQTMGPAFMDVVKRAVSEYAETKTAPATASPAESKPAAAPAAAPKAAPAAAPAAASEPPVTVDPTGVMPDAKDMVATLVGLSGQDDDDIMEWYDVEFPSSLVEPRSLVDVLALYKALVGPAQLAPLWYSHGKPPASGKLDDGKGPFAPLIFRRCTRGPVYLANHAAFRLRDYLNSGLAPPTALEQVQEATLEFAPALDSLCEEASTTLLDVEPPSVLPDGRKPCGCRLEFSYDEGCYLAYGCMVLAELKNTRDYRRFDSIKRSMLQAVLNRRWPDKEDDCHPGFTPDYEPLCDAWEDIVNDFAALVKNLARSRFYAPPAEAPPLSVQSHVLALRCMMRGLVMTQVRSALLGQGLYRTIVYMRSGIYRLTLTHRAPHAVHSISRRLPRASSWTSMIRRCTSRPSPQRS